MFVPGQPSFAALDPYGTAYVPQTAVAMQPTYAAYGGVPVAVANAYAAAPTAWISEPSAQSQMPQSGGLLDAIASTLTQSATPLQPQLQAQAAVAPAAQEQPAPLADAGMGAGALGTVVDGAGNVYTATLPLAQGVAASTQKV